MAPLPASIAAMRTATAATESMVAGIGTDPKTADPLGSETEGHRPLARPRGMTVMLGIEALGAGVHLGLEVARILIRTFRLTSGMTASPDEGMIALPGMIALLETTAPGKNGPGTTAGAATAGKIDATTEIAEL